MVDAFTIQGLQILINDQWHSDKVLLIEGNIISHITSAQQIAGIRKTYSFPSNYYLVPGFIDMHIHGAKGFDVMDGTFEALNTISKALAAEGVTGFLATTMTADDTTLDFVLRNIADHHHKVQGAALLGVHLEGPFISVKHLGAQLAITQLPHLEKLRKWHHQSNCLIKLVTLAPELPNAIAVIQGLTEMGIIPSLGHTNATYEESLAAIKAGACYVTHLFNAMRPLHHRHPGLVGAALNSNVTAELIVDLYHLHPAAIEIALRVKGIEQLILISDAMRAKCLGDGEYDLGGQLTQVVKGKATLENGTLAGSTLTIPQAIKNIIQHTSCDLISAIKMVSLNPSKLLGNQTGEIKAGKKADLVVLNDQLEVVLTLKAGQEIFKLVLN
jgi:N-acetylglucosamine-6-phosphate deacetylase